MRGRDGVKSVNGRLVDGVESRGTFEGGEMSLEGLRRVGGVGKFIRGEVSMSLWG